MKGLLHWSVSSYTETYQLSINLFKQISNRLTMPFHQLAWIALFVLSINTTLQSQNSTCATAATLMIDSNCAGTTGGANAGDPTGNDDTDGNVCSANYSGGDDFIFEYTATTTDALMLNLTTTNTWSGLMVTAGCPTTGTCFASSNSSATTESLTTPAMTIGQVYYIHISTWPSPQSAGQFCLNAALISPPMPPANDDCGGAFMLDVNGDLACGNTTAGTIDIATASPEDGAACSGTEDDDVWFSFVATATSHRIDLLNVANGTTDLYHSVWEGGCGSLTLVTGTCSDPNSSTVAGLTIGNTYFLRVYSWTSTTGQTTTFDVCIGSFPPPPVNDDCAGAISIADGGSETGSTAAATNIESLAACSGGGGGGDCATGGTGTVDFTEGLWYVYTSTVTGETITAATDNVGTTFDTELAVYEGTCGALTCVGGDDDGGDGTGHNFDSSLCWVSTGTPGTPVNYYIYVDGHGGATGDYNLTLDVVPPPAPPANNDCASATLLAEDSPTGAGFPAQSLVGATASGVAAPTCDAANTDPLLDVWYRVNTDNDGGELSIDATPGVSSDLVITLYDGCSGSELACSDNIGNGVAESLTYTDPAFTDKGGSSSRSDVDYFVRVYEKVASGDDFTVAASGAALPIELIDFKGEVTKAGNILKWSTASEMNNDFQAIERSKDGKGNWEEVDRFASKGSASKGAEYDMIDRNPYAISYYRLRSVDYDGREQLSDIISLERNLNKEISAYPNPTSDVFNIEIVSDVKEKMTTEIYDVAGRLVLSTSINLDEGITLTPMDVSGISAGIYMVNVTTGTQTKLIRLIIE